MKKLLIAPLALIVSLLLSPVFAAVPAAGSLDLVPVEAYTLQVDTEAIEVAGAPEPLDGKTISLKPWQSTGSPLNGDDDGEELPEAASWRGKTMYASAPFHKDRIPIIDH